MSGNDSSFNSSKPCWGSVTENNVYRVFLVSKRYLVDTLWSRAIFLSIIALVTSSFLDKCLRSNYLFSISSARTGRATSFPGPLLFPRREEPDTLGTRLEQEVHKPGISIWNTRETKNIYQIYGNNKLDETATLVRV